MKLKTLILTLILTVVMAGVCSAAWAGDIEGKVTGMKGQSVVYVDTIAGKTFPAAKEHPVMDQKGLMFAPHIMVVQQGTTVEFLNSDSVQHNVFWTAIGTDKKAGHNLGTWPKGEKRPYTFDKAGVCRCSAMYIRKWRHISSSARLLISPRLTMLATTRSRTFPTAATRLPFGTRARRISQAGHCFRRRKADFTLSK